MTSSDRYNLRKMWVHLEHGGVGCDHAPTHPVGPTETDHTAGTKPRGTAPLQCSTLVVANMKIQNKIKDSLLFYSQQD